MEFLKPFLNIYRLKIIIKIFIVFLLIKIKKKVNFKINLITFSLQIMGKKNKILNHWNWQNKTVYKKL